MSKKLLILGAGVYQVPLIKKAKEMGLYTIVSSIPGNYPGFSLADKVYYCNTTDKEAILEIAKNEGVSGLCTAGTDVAIASIGYANQQLGLAGVGEEAARKTADKAVMQEAFDRGGVASARSIRAGSLDEVRKAAAEIGLPVVVKCVDSSGARGIRIVDNSEDLEEAFEYALKYSHKDYVLVESKLPGKEIGIDGIVCDGKLIFVAPHKKSIYKSGQTMVTAGHNFPYEGSDKLLEEIKCQTQNAVDALGLDYCAVNLDAFVDGDDCYIIEIGGRSGATCIPELIERCYGFNYYERIIDLALGIPVSVPAGKKQTCKARLMMSPVDGTVTGIDEEGLDLIRADGIDVSLDVGAGDEVEVMTNGTNRLGAVIADTDEEAEMFSIMDRVYRCVYVDGTSLSDIWKNNNR